MSTAFASFALLQAVAVEQGFMRDDECLRPEQFEKEVDSMVDEAFDGINSKQIKSRILWSST